MNQPIKLSIELAAPDITANVYGVANAVHWDVDRARAVKVARRGASTPN